jgi:uncharacterized protein
MVTNHAGEGRVGGGVFESLESDREGAGDPLRRGPPSDRFGSALRGFGPVGILAIVVIMAGNLLFLPLSAILVLVWASRSGTPWRDIGFVRPRNWTRGLLTGVIFGVAFKLVMKAVVMPLLRADPVNPAYHYLVGNTAALPAAAYTMIVGAGFGEETVFRGFVFERLGRLLGRGVWEKAGIVLISAVFFAAAHYPEQGLAGAEQAMITGLVFGTIFAATGRLWMLMCAHAAFDLAAVAIIYLDLETSVAHAVFRQG